MKYFSKNSKNGLSSGMFGILKRCCGVLSRFAVVLILTTAAEFFSINGVKSGSDCADNECAEKYTRIPVRTVKICVCLFIGEPFDVRIVNK